MSGGASCLRNCIRGRGEERRNGARGEMKQEEEVVEYERFGGKKIEKGGRVDE